MTHAYRMTAVFSVCALAVVACDDKPGGGGKGKQPTMHEREIEGDGATKVKAEIWVDNWFALSINGEPLIEDSVAFKTERSFNAERVTFNVDLPATVAFEFRDFREDDTGLEYIGTSRQQIGDGGAIVQFTDVKTGAVLSVSDSQWKCHVINHAPRDESCADEDKPQVGVGACAADISDAPEGWTAPDFDDSQWASATEHSAGDVSPKFGYDEVEWSPEAKLIWSKNLKLDNTVLCRTVIGEN